MDSFVSLVYGYLSTFSILCARIVCACVRTISLCMCVETVEVYRGAYYLISHFYINRVSREGEYCRFCHTFTYVVLFLLLYYNFYKTLAHTYTAYDNYSEEYVWFDCMLRIFFFNGRSFGTKRIMFFENLCS